MPYFVASIITITSALIVLMTRFDADDSMITAELDRVKAMIQSIDQYVDTYIVALNGDLTTINFEVLFESGILPNNVNKSPIGDTNEEVDGEGFSSVLSFPRNSVRWHILPIRDITGEVDSEDFASSSGSAYKLLVDISQNRDLMSKSRFSESFIGREFCEKMLFGTLQENRRTYVSPSIGEENFANNGTNDDGFFVCIIFK